MLIKFWSSFVVNIILAFITGLTTGGLSCLAVQGGLLASSLSNQIESDLLKKSSKTNKEKSGQTKNRSQFALPILVFLMAKLAAYTGLGFLLGIVGQVFQLSPYARAFLQIAVGVFMLGTALRMLNVHPIFRVFAFEPPAILRRKLRKAANGADQGKLYAPALLGLFTVLIPCGVTQAMMAVALGSGDPFQGAALMFAFTLGTSPVFFLIAYFTTSLGARLEKNFMRFVALIILVLSLVTIDGGVTLAGSPISLSRMFQQITSPLIKEANLQENEPTQSNSLSAGINVDPFSLPDYSSNGDSSEIIINVINSGYSPEVLHAKAGVPVKLHLVSENVRSCSRAFVIPSLGVQLLLEATGEVVVDIPAQENGTQIPFSCSMGMYGGTIVFDL